MKWWHFCDASLWKSRPHADGFQWNLVGSKLIDWSQRSEKMVCRRFNWPMKVGVQSGLCYCGFLEPWFSQSGCDGECFAPYWAALDQENEKDNALEVSCLSIVQPAQGNCGKWGQKWVTGDVNSFFSWFEIRGDLKSFERSTSLEWLRGAPRSDPGVILRWFQDFSTIMIFHQNDAILDTNPGEFQGRLQTDFNETWI